ncbi:MAG: HAD family phosphatase [Bacteroidaceae bacterium]|nr:HAD family phosphatase [Bacteroidaceae bacterium]
MKEAKHYSSPKGGGREGAITDIIFDLGGVLLDLNMEGIGQACQRLGINPELFFVKTDEKNTSTVCQGISASKAITAYQVGEITSEQFLFLVLSHCGEGITREDIIEAWNSCIGLIPMERLDMIKELRRKGYHTHLLSNTNDLHWEEIKRRYLSQEGYTCKELFDNVFVSHEVHLAKPAPEIYQYAISQIGRPAAQCLFIDDTLLNVEAARREGLQGVWLDIRDKDALKSSLDSYLKC